VAQALLSRGGVTGWVAGYPVVVGEELAATLDLAFPDVLLAIEIDGWAWHTDPERFQVDRRRQNALVTAGWTVLRFTWADLVERPAQVLATVVSALSGLAGAPQTHR
jgi:very-short-patch-repair endonuclease